MNIEETKENNQLDEQESIRQSIIHGKYRLNGSVTMQDGRLYGFGFEGIRPRVVHIVAWICVLLVPVMFIMSAIFAFVYRPMMALCLAIILLLVVMGVYFFIIVHKAQNKNIEIAHAAFDTEKG